MNKIKVIIKRPDEEFGHVTWISDTLQNLQKTVEGPIETLSIGGSTVLIMNEEGKLRRDVEPNFFIREHGYKDIVCGTVIVAGNDGSEEFVDIPISLDAWKEILMKWGN